MADELDLSNLDDVDDIDWSDVEAELQQNRQMIMTEAGGGGGDDSADMSMLGGGDGGDTISDAGEVELDFLMDVPLHLIVEVGKTRLLIKDLLRIDLNSVIELRKRIGEPMDVKINEKLVAKGEVVVQHEKFGLRITEILDRKKRLEKLRG